jgi:hypothetical protein
MSKQYFADCLGRLHKITSVPLVKIRKTEVLRYYFYRFSEVDILGMAENVLRTAVSVNMDPQC